MHDSLRSWAMTAVTPGKERTELEMYELPRQHTLKHKLGGDAVVTLSKLALKQHNNEDGTRGGYAVTADYAPHATWPWKTTIVGRHQSQP
eukprot:6460204-Amphidinium_carterae.2